MTLSKKGTQESGSQRLFIEPGLLRPMIETMVRELLEEEVSRHLGAAPYERSEHRRGRRNGTKPRTMKTGVGELSFAVPQVREPGFRTELFERWQRSDKALIAAMQEMVVAGVSTRDVAKVLEEMGGFEVSAATVSRTMAELDEEIGCFFSRPLAGIRFPYLFIDARYEKVRREGRVRSHAVLIAVGVREDGGREILAMTGGDSESEASWGEMLAGMKKRGLGGVEMIVSDAHAGIKAAIARHFQGAAWQRCRVHLIRELLAKVSYKDHYELAKDLRAIYASEEKKQCMKVAREVAQKWESRAPKMAAALCEGVEDSLCAWNLPRALRRKLNSTNMLERLMKEIKKRTRKVGSFPNEAACLRMTGAVLLETQDVWDGEDKRYIRAPKN